MRRTRCTSIEDYTILIDMIGLDTLEKLSRKKDLFTESNND